MNQSDKLPWPQSPDQINPAFIDDLTEKVAAATNESGETNKSNIMTIINDEIEAHYKKRGQA